MFVHHYKHDRRAIVALLVGAGIGVFHAGVELGYWEGPTTCTGGDVSSLSTAELIAKIQSAPLVRCDEVAWSFLGVSMAGWNGLIALAAGVAALAVVWRDVKRIGST